MFLAIGMIGCLFVVLQVCNMLLKMEIFIYMHYLAYHFPSKLYRSWVLYTPLSWLGGSDPQSRE